jgi:gamma-glutamyltranspeptidase
VHDGQGNNMRDSSATLRKSANRPWSPGGIVAAQSRKAAQVGADVLAAGGDCVDAVVVAKVPRQRRGLLVSTLT